MWNFYEKPVHEDECDYCHYHFPNEWPNFMLTFDGEEVLCPKCYVRKEKARQNQGNVDCGAGPKLN